VTVKVGQEFVLRLALRYECIWT